MGRGINVAHSGHLSYVPGLSTLCQKEEKGRLRAQEQEGGVRVNVRVAGMMGVYNCEVYAQHGSYTGGRGTP